MEPEPRPALPLVEPEYARPIQKSIPRAPLRFAAVCGAVPLTIGCATFLFWLHFRTEELEFLGFYNIIFGILAVSVGGLVLLFWFLAMAPGPRRCSRFLAESWLAIILLLVNFPAAVLIVHAVNYVEGAYPVAHSPS